MKKIKVYFDNDINVKLCKFGNYSYERIDSLEPGCVYIGSGNFAENSKNFNASTFSVAMYRKHKFADMFIKYTPTDEFEIFELSVLLYARLFGDTEDGLNELMLDEFKTRFGPGGKDGHASSFMTLGRTGSSFEKWVNLFSTYKEVIWGEDESSN